MEEICEQFDLATVPRYPTPGLRPVMELAGIPEQLIDFTATRNTAACVSGCRAGFGRAGLPVAPIECPLTGPMADRDRPRAPRHPRWLRCRTLTPTLILGVHLTYGQAVHPAVPCSALDCLRLCLTSIACRWWRVVRFVLG
jgi:hypothetical protein